MFDKNDFVESVIARNLGLKEIIKDARDEIDLTESISRPVKGAPETRAAGSGEYVRFLGSLVFYLQSRSTPAGISDDNFQLLRRLAQHLVDRGDLTSDVFELFDAGE